MSATPFVFSNSETITSLLDQSITRHYLSTVQQPADKIVAEYVWIGGTGQDLRSKGRWDWVGMASRCWARLIRLSAKGQHLRDLPAWLWRRSLTHAASFAMRPQDSAQQALQARGEGLFSMAISGACVCMRMAEADPATPPHHAPRTCLCGTMMAHPRVRRQATTQRCTWCPAPSSRTPSAVRTVNT